MVSVFTVFFFTYDEGNWKIRAFKEALNAAVIKRERSGRQPTCFNNHVSLVRDAVKTGLHHQGASMSLHRLMVYLTTAWLFVFMIAFNLIVLIIRCISPSLAKKLILKMGEKSTMTQNPNFKYEDWGLTFGTFTFIKTALQHLWLLLGQDAFVGGEAPDTPVVTMEGKKTSICKYLKGELWKSSFHVVVQLYLYLCLLPKVRAVLSLQATDHWC